MSPAAQGESLIDGRVIFECQISSYFGWGVYGLKPAAQLVEVQGPVAIDLGRVPEAPGRYCRRAAGDFTSGPIVLCYLHTHRIC